MAVAHYTLKEFEQHIAANPDRLFELVHGELVEKVPTEEHAHIAGIIAGEFHLYLKLHPAINGRFGVEARFRPVGDQTNDRMPDVFLRYTDAPRVKQGPVVGMPDVTVEIKSPDDTYREMRERADYYLNNGCRMVWLIFPDKQLVEVYQPDTDIQILQSGDTIKGGTVIPDFELVVDALFAD